MPCKNALGGSIISSCRRIQTSEPSMHRCIDCWPELKGEIGAMAMPAGGRRPLH